MVKKHYVDVKGDRVYACSANCIEKITADPKKYLAKIKSNGETPEQTPIAIREK